ncbi:MAG: inositol 2-dehydrogenase, partial [Rhizobium sp.]|nr:inositol 2-dehydrogenase [Rhizobium sp.]
PAEYIKVSGGIFRDMTIHDFDMARFLLGEEIETVMASASVLVDPKIGELGDYDSASLILTTKSGRQAVISNSRRASYGYDQRIEVHGSLGAVSAENQRPVSIEIATSNGYTRPPLHDFFMTRYTAAYAAEISAFIDSLEKGTPLSPSAEDGLIALALADAALKSVELKAAVKVAY